MSSTSSIRIPSRTNIFKAEQNRQLSRIPTSNLSFPRHNLKKTRLASELVIHKSRISKTSFECRCAVSESEGGPVSAAGERKKKKLAVFVSGGGSNFRSIHEATVGGSVHGDFAVLVTDKPGCGGAEYARAKGIPVILFSKTKASPEGLSPVELVTTLRNLNVDFILLAGYLKLVPAELVQAYLRSIVNIHPSLLPTFGGKGFYGFKEHRAVIASGASSFSPLQVNKAPMRTFSMPWPSRRGNTKDDNRNKQKVDSNEAEAYLEEFGVTHHLIDHIKGFNINTFKDFPLHDESKVDGAASSAINVNKDLNDWQERHATLVLSRVKELSQLRYVLCPCHLKDKQFWRIYFLLVKSFVSPYEIRALQKAKLRMMVLENEKSVGKASIEVEMTDVEHASGKSNQNHL